MTIPTDGDCFVCGINNQWGLQAEFSIDHEAERLTGRERSRGSMSPALSVAVE